MLVIEYFGKYLKKVFSYRVKLFILIGMYEDELKYFYVIRVVKCYFVDFRIIEDLIIESIEFSDG